MKPYCHVVAVLAVAIEEARQFVSSRCQSSISLRLWIVFEFTNDARTRKIRAGSDFEVIRTSTRTYMYVRYKEFFSTLLTSVGLAHARPKYYVLGLLSSDAVSCI